MPKHILVYKIEDYVDMGGGLYIEYPTSKDDMEKMVNSLFQSYKDKMEIVCAGWLQVEYTIKPIKYVTEFEIEE